MKLTTKQIVGFGCVLLLISQGENIRKSIEKDSIRKDARTLKQERIRDDKDKIKELEELSKIALQRADSCIEVLDVTTNKPIELSPSTKVFNSSKTDELREGATVCSGSDTGLIGKDGLVSNIARVNKTDEPIFNKIRGQSK